MGCTLTCWLALVRRCVRTAVAQVLLPLGAVGKDYTQGPVCRVLTIFQEASIADISYLFEEGALVDFEISELINLVRALFADTPLRANTINKLMQGHPVRSEA